jgi:hypothetical protein
MKCKEKILTIGNSKGACRPKAILEEAYLVGAVVGRARLIKVWLAALSGCVKAEKIHFPNYHKTTV